MEIRRSAQKSANNFGGIRSVSEKWSLGLQNSEEGQSGRAKKWLAAGQPTSEPGTLLAANQVIASHVEGAEIYRSKDWCRGYATPFEEGFWKPNRSGPHRWPLGGRHPNSGGETKSQRESMSISIVEWPPPMKQASSATFDIRPLETRTIRSCVGSLPRCKNRSTGPELEKSVACWYEGRELARDRGKSRNRCASTVHWTLDPRRWSGKPAENQRHDGRAYLVDAEATCARVNLVRDHTGSEMAPTGLLSLLVPTPSYLRIPGMALFCFLAPFSLAAPANQWQLCGPNRR